MSPRQASLIAALLLGLAALAACSSAGDPPANADSSSDRSDATGHDFAANPDARGIGDGITDEGRAGGDVPLQDFREHRAPEMPELQSETRIDQWPPDTHVPDAEVQQPPIVPLVLNEVRCTDGDFIELYNASPDTEASLEGWAVADGSSADHQYLLTGQPPLGPGQWRVIPKVSDENPSNGFPFGLSCGNDTVRLWAPGNVLADQVELPSMQAGETWGRLPDGSGVWQTTGPTPQAANQPVVDVAQTLFSSDKVVQIDLTVSQEGVASINENPYEYVSGSFHLISGEFQTAEMAVGVRLKGRWGSFQPLEGKASFKISFNFTNPLGRLLGLKRMTLNSMVSDPAMINELVAYRLFEAYGLPGPRVGYAWVRLNGQDYGLYAIIEAFDDTWLDHHFETTGHLYEGGYSADFVPGSEALFEVDEGDENDLSDLTSFMELVQASSADTFMSTVGARLDVPAFARLMAVEHYTGHWDGYATAINNWYIHFDDAGFATMIPWGTDQVFSQYLPFYFGSAVLFRKCMASDECRGIYDQALLGLVGLVDLVEPEALASDTAAFLRPWIEADPRKPCTNQEAVEALQEALEYMWNQRGRIGELDQCIYHPETLDIDQDGRVCDMDCSEGDATTYVDAPEICTDVVDNDCNWLTDDGPGCPDCVDLFMGNHAYVVCLSKRNYAAAQEACQQHGMSVVEIDSDIEEGWVLDVVYTYGLIESWIGLTRQPDGQFAWENGAPLVYSNWEEGEPNGTPGYSDCVQIFTWKNWIDTSCNTTNAVICESACPNEGDQDGDGYAACTQDCDDTSAESHPEARDASGPCADGIDQDCDGVPDNGLPCVPEYWLETPGIEGAAFVFLDSEETREKGRLLCQELAAGGDLAWFALPAELTQVSAALELAAPNAVVWIGLQDLSVEGQYFWADGSPPTFLPWAPGQPNNYGDAEDCCRLQPGGTFNDTDCASTFHVLCRVPQ